MLSAKHSLKNKARRFLFVFSFYLRNFFFPADDKFYSSYNFMLVFLECSTGISDFL